MFLRTISHKREVATRIHGKVYFKEENVANKEEVHAEKNTEKCK